MYKDVFVIKEPEGDQNETGRGQNGFLHETDTTVIVYTPIRDLPMELRS